MSLNRLARAAVALAATAAVATVAACGSTTDGAASASDTAVTAVATTGAWADVIAAVGGEHVTATAIIGEGVDPHDHQTSPIEVVEVRDADLVLVNGGGYDGFMTQILGSIDPPEVLITVADLDTAGPAGDPDNEHLWFDPSTVIAAADAIADGLIAIDPDHAADYRVGAEEFTAAVAELEVRLAAIAATDPAPVATTEPVLGHLLAAAGIADLTPPEFGEAIEHGSDPSPAALAELREIIASADVAALVYNTHTENPTTREVRRSAESAGVPVIDVSESMPAGTDYLTWTDQIVTELEQAVAR